MRTQFEVYIRIEPFSEPGQCAGTMKNRHGHVQWLIGRGQFQAAQLGLREIERAAMKLAG
jgi:hypothetical protein